MIASEKRTSSFEYSNGCTTEERYMLKLTRPQIGMKKKVEEDELGIFGAEKYFKGVIDEDLLRASNNKSVHVHAYDHNHSIRPHEEHEELYQGNKPKTPPSVRSESSWNSRKGLLVSNGNDRRKKNGVKSLLASLGCNCNDQESVKITDKKVNVKEAVKQPVKVGDLVPKRKPLSSTWVDEDVNIKREDCFTFPVMNSSMADVKHPELPEEERGREGKKSFTLDRKLTMLNWGGVTPKAENIDISRNGGQNDTGSDASSDLFEIESFSTNENNSFLARQAVDKMNDYAPSEVSIDWSVVTASVADYSTPDDLIVSRTVSGCKSHKAVRVSSDEQRMAGGGEKAAVMVVPARREWCRRLNSITPVAKIQADNKLIGAGSVSIGQNRFDTTRSIPFTHSTHASHQLYMQH